MSDGANIDDIITTDEQQLVLEGLIELELITIEENEDGAKVYNSEGTLLFTIDKDGVITLGDGISSSDSIVYELTDDDKASLAREGKFINNIVLKFGSQYIILEGANQTYYKGTGTGLRIKANGLLSKLVEMRRNGKKIESGCNLTSGSTVATLSSSYLDELELGTYELTFVYVDGEVSTNFTIAQVENPAGGGEAVGGIATTLLSSSPLTGDNIVGWVILLVISANCLIAVEVYIRKVFNKK